MRRRRRGAVAIAGLTAAAAGAGKAPASIVQATFLTSFNNSVDGYVQSDPGHFRATQHDFQSHAPPLDMTSTYVYSATDTFDGAFFSSRYQIDYSFSDTAASFHLGIDSQAVVHATVDGAAAEGRAEAYAGVGYSDLEFQVLAGPVLYTGTYAITDSDGISIAPGTLLVAGLYSVHTPSQVSAGVVALPGDDLVDTKTASMFFDFAAVPGPGAPAVAGAGLLMAGRRRRSGAPAGLHAP